MTFHSSTYYTRISIRTGKRNPWRRSVVITEAQNLDEALEVLAGERRQDARTKGARGPRSLRQQFALAKGQALLKKIQGKISLANGQTSKVTAPRKPPKAPHPLQDLAPEAKRLKAREMYEGGHWGLGTYAMRKLARAFAVPTGQMVEWLDGCKGAL
jgi:hypothetical protein